MSSNDEKKTSATEISSTNVPEKTAEESLIESLKPAVAQTIKLGLAKTEAEALEYLINKYKQDPIFKYTIDSENVQKPIGGKILDQEIADCVKEGGTVSECEEKLAGATAMTATNTSIPTSVTNSTTATTSNFTLVTGTGTADTDGITDLSTNGATFTITKIAPTTSLNQKLTITPTKQESKVPVPELKKIKNSFKWVNPLEIDPEKMMMIKGVAMTEGEMKRGEIMSRDNIIFGAGAMSAMGMLGLATIDVDHFHDRLPEKYEKKYGMDINAPFPPAFIYDAAVEENEVEENGVKRKIAQVEFIGFCVNRKVYELIKQKKFVGTSVVDFYRKERCECGAKPGVACGCSIEGSHFLNLTLVLDEVPNSNGTWVAPVTKEDIGTIIVPGTAPGKFNLRHSMKEKLLKIAMHAVDSDMGDCVTHMKEHHPDWTQEQLVAVCMNKTGTSTVEQACGCVANAKRKEYGLERYYDEPSDSFNFSQESIGDLEEFLMHEKGVSQETAHRIAQYLTENPKSLTGYQLQYLSALDLVQWISHSQMNVLKATLAELTKRIEPKVEENKTTIKVSGDGDVKITMGNDAPAIPAPAATPAEQTATVKNNEVYKCKIDGEEFDSQEALDAHMKEKHPVEEPVKENSEVKESKVEGEEAKKVLETVVDTKKAEERVTKLMEADTQAKAVITPEEVKPTAVVEKDAVPNPATAPKVQRMPIEEKKKILASLEKVQLPAGRNVSGAELAQAYQKFRDYVKKDIAEDSV